MCFRSVPEYRKDVASVLEENQESIRKQNWQQAVDSILIGALASFAVAISGGQDEHAMES